MPSPNAYPSPILKRPETTPNHPDTESLIVRCCQLPSLSARAILLYRATSFGVSKHPTRMTISVWREHWNPISLFPSVGWLASSSISVARSPSEENPERSDLAKTFLLVSLPPVIRILRLFILPFCRLLDHPSLCEAECDHLASTRKSTGDLCH